MHLCIIYPCEYIHTICKLHTRAYESVYMYVASYTRVLMKACSCMLQATHMSAYESVYMYVYFHNKLCHYKCTYVNTQHKLIYSCTNVYVSTHTPVHNTSL